MVLGGGFRKVYSGSARQWLNKVGNLIPSKLNGFTEIVKENFSYAVDEFEIDLDDPLGMIKHYRNLRGRLIGGRNSYELKKFTLITPLTDPTLPALDRALGGGVANEIYRDIMVLGGGKELARHSFDEERKNFPEGFLEKSKFLSFPKEMPVKSYDIYGGKGDNAVSESRSGDSLQAIIAEELCSLVKKGVPESMPIEFSQLISQESPLSHDERKRKIEVNVLHGLLKLYDIVG